MQVIYCLENTNAFNFQIMRGIAERRCCSQVAAKIYKRKVSKENPERVLEGFLESIYAAKKDEPSILVGSGHGAYACSIASNTHQPFLGLFLLSPARISSFRAAKTMILHGTNDEVYPYTNVFDRAVRMERNPYPGIRQTYDIKLVEDDHHLSFSPNVLDSQFTRFLRDCSEAWAAYSGVIF